MRELSLTTSPAEFLAAFRMWLRGPYPGAFDLLHELKPHYRLACLSNTNALDVARFRDELQLHERFDHCFFSNEMGLRKPEPACYHRVVEHLGLLPDEISFFDDSLECVSGARDMGIRAYQCDGIEALRNTLRRLDICPRRDDSRGHGSQLKC